MTWDFNERFSISRKKPLSGQVWEAKPNRSFSTTCTSTAGTIYSTLIFPIALKGSARSTPPSWCSKTEEHTSKILASFELSSPANCLFERWRSAGRKPPAFTTARKLPSCGGSDEARAALFASDSRHGQHCAVLLHAAADRPRGGPAEHPGVGMGGSRTDSALRPETYLAGAGMELLRAN